MTTETDNGTEIEYFLCNDCKRWVPIQYRCERMPYGVQTSVCTMCISYWDYLNGTYDEDEPDEWEGEDDW